MLIMTNCKSPLTKFESQINSIFETFKGLPQHEKKEAISLIKSLHSRSVKFMVNNSNATSAATTSSVTSVTSAHHSVTANNVLTSSKVAVCKDLQNQLLDLNKTPGKKLIINNKSIPVLHVQELPLGNNVNKSVSPLKVNSSSHIENVIGKSVEYMLQISNNSAVVKNNITSSVSQDTLISNEMKEILASSKIVVLDNPPVDSKVCVNSKKKKNVKKKLEGSHKQLTEKDIPLAKSFDLKKDVTKKSIVLRSAEKLKKKAMTKFIFQPDVSGQSHSNRNKNSCEAENTDSALTTDNNFIVSCWFCKTSFKSMDNLKMHSCYVSIKEKNYLEKKSYVYECLLCRITFLRLGHLRRHLDCHIRNVCKICDFRFARQNALCQHMKVAHNSGKLRKFVCEFCEKDFSKKTVLHRHLQEMHANGKSVCPKCGEFFESKTVYSEHIKMHGDEKNYFCKQCDKSFERKQQYEQHQMGHTRHVCSSCKISFPTKKLWQKHQHSTHGAHHEEKKHKCVTCQKTFLRPMHLRLHLRTHTGEKPTRCFQCEKNFSNARTLAMHMKTPSHLKHVEGQKDQVTSVDKPFLCALCGARFFRQQSLSRHTEQIHSCKTSLKCTHCEYTTKCEANLKRHTMLHTGPKRYVCEKCGSSFHAMATLNEHQAYVHSEKRCFVCSLCSKGFKGKSGLQRHMRIHSEVRPYKCHCNRSYKRMSHLKRHMSNSHHIILKSSKLQNVNSDPVSKSNSVAPNNFLSSLSNTNNTIMKDQATSADLSSLLNSTDAFNMDPGELREESSAYDLNAAANDNFLVLSSADINYMPANYTTLNIPATTCDLIAVNNTPSSDLHLPPQVAPLSVPSVPQECVSVTCADAALDHLQAQVLEAEQFSKSDLSLLNSFSNYSTPDANNAFSTLPISTFLMNMGLPPSHLTGNESLSEMDACSSKQLFDESAALLGMSQFPSGVNLGMNKDMSLSKPLPSVVDSLWESSDGKQKALIENRTLLSFAADIGASLAKSSDTLQVTDDFPESLLFQNEPSVNCPLIPGSLQDDNVLDTLSSQMYSESMKQLLSIS